MAVADPVTQLWEIVTKGSESALKNLSAAATKTSTEVEKGAKAAAKMSTQLDGLKKMALGAAGAFIGFREIKKFLKGAVGDAMENATKSTEEALGRIKKFTDFFQIHVTEKIGAALISAFDVITTKALPALQDLLNGVGPVADVVRAFGVAFQVLGDLIMAVVVPAFDAAKTGVEAVRVAIEDASGAPVTWSEIFAASAETVSTTANDIKIRVEQAFTTMAGVATFAFLKIHTVISDALAKVLETASSAFAKVAEIVPADLGGDLLASIAAKAAGMGQSLRDGANTGRDAIDGLFDKVIDLNEGIGQEGVAIAAVMPLKVDHTRQTKEQRKAIEDAAKAQDAFNKSLGLISASDFSMKLGQITKAVEELKRRGITSGPVFEALNKQIEALGVAAGAAAIPVSKLFAKDFLAAAGKNIAPQIAEIKTEVSGLIPPLGMVNGKLEDWDALETAERLRVEGEAAQQYASQISGISGSISDLVGAFASGNLSLKDGIGGVMGILGQAASSQKGFGAGLSAGLKDAFKGGGSATGGIAAGFENLAQNMGNKAMSTGQKIGGAVGTGVGMYFGGPLGAAIGGKVGTFIGGLIQKPPFKKVQKDVQKNLGVALSEGTAQAIVDASKAAGVSTKIGTLLSLDKIIAEAKIDSSNAGKFAGQFDQLTKLAQSGAKGSTEAIKSIGAAFPALIGKFREAGMEGTKAFGDLVRSAKKMSAVVPEIAEFLRQGVSSATGALSALFGAVRLGGADAAKSMENLGLISTDVLSAMATLPGGARAAIAQLGDGLDKIAEKANKAGVAIPEGIAGLIGQREFFKANADLYDSLDALVGITKGLGETGFISAQGFAAIQSQASLTFSQLTGAGRDSNQALADMAPVLQEIINEHGRNGQTIDANTQGLINQAAQLGLVKLAGTDAFAAMRTESNYLLGGIASIFGKEGKIKQYMAETAAAAGQTAAGVSTAWSGAASLASQSWSSTAKQVLAEQQSITSQSTALAAGAAQAVTATAAATVASVSSVVEGTSGKFRSLAGRIKAALAEARGFDIGALPEFHTGGYTGDGSGEFMAKLKRREFVLDEKSTARLGGQRALSAAQSGDDSLLRAALGAVSSSRDQRVPVRASGSGGGGSNVVAVPVNMQGAIMQLVAVDGRPLGNFLVTEVSRGNQERTIARQQAEEIV